MAHPYLQILKDLIGRLDLPADQEIVCKHFFSGAAAWADEQIFISLTPAGLALKLPDEDCQALFAEGGKPLRYFPEAPVKEGYVILPEALSGSDDVLRPLVVKSLQALSG